MRGEKTRNRVGWVGRIGATAVLVFLLCLLLLPAIFPTARAAPLPARAPLRPDITGIPSEAPNFEGSYVVDHGQIFVYLGYAGFANLWNGVGLNGSEVFADSLWILAFNLENYPVTLTVDTKERGYPPSDVSVPISSFGTVSIPIALEQNPAWTNVTVLMGGVAWSGLVATPVSLLPLSDWNLGGLDLIVMVALSEAVIGFSLLTWVAWRLMKRGLWAPKFSLIVWGHVFLLTTFVTVIGDYQFIDQTFGGWSPLIYIAPLFPMWFAFALSFFNRSTKRECLQIASLPNQRLLIGRYLLRLGKTLVGDIVLIKESWGQFWARVFGHYVTLTPKDITKAAPLVVPVSNLRSPTASGKKQRKEGGARKPSSLQWDAAPIVNDAEQEDEVDSVSFVKAGATVQVRYPRLTMTKIVHVEAETITRKNGDTKEIPAHDERRWSLPHYVEGSAETLPLEDIHYVNAVGVSAGWLNAADLSHVIGETKTALFIAESQKASRIEAEVDARLTAYLSLMGFTPNELSMEEADEAAQKRRNEPSAPPQPRAKGAN